MKYLPLLAATLACPLLAAENLAWFLTARLEPSQHEVAGMPLSTFDATLAAVTIPTHADLPKGNEIGVSDILAGDVFFDVSVDLTGDGKKERALTGAYIDRDGTTGRFLVIIGPSKAGSPAVLLLYKVRHEPGFAFIRKRKGGLLWSFCLYCGSYSTVRWDGSKFEVRDEDIPDEG